MDRNSGQVGFTLLEVLAVLAIMSLVIAIALPRIGLNASPAATEAIAMRIIAALDEDRFTSRRRGAPMTSELDLRQNRIRFASRTLPYLLPSSIKLGIRSAPACEPSGQRITFFPDGSACAPLLLVASTTASYVIAINPLTGAISLGQ